MSQSRTRKPPPGADGSRPRPIAKASGDANKTQQVNQTHHHHRSKRIPKSIRYDLENALVGLCDVWFEDIKPHLLRNNIKVHVHAGEAGAGGGDQRGRLPPGAPGCSHLDPGAASDVQRRSAVSCADSSSTQPTASRALSRRPRAPPFKLLSPLPSPPRPLTPQSRCPTYEEENAPPKAPLASPSSSRSRQRRRCRPHPRTSPPNYVIPRLCRTTSVPARNTESQTCCKMGRTVSQQYPPVTYKRPLRPVLELRMPSCNPRRRPRMVDKVTQTEGPPLRRRSARSSPARRRSPAHRSPAQRTPVQRSPAQRSSPTQRSPTHSRSPSPPSRRPSPINRVPATTTLFPSRGQPSPPLFPDELIDIIGDTHNQIVEMLYESPRRSTYPSTMNLVRTAVTRTDVKKIPPWR